MICRLIFADLYADDSNAQISGKTQTTDLLEGRLSQSIGREYGPEQGLKTVSFNP